MDWQNRRLMAAAQQGNMRPPGGMPVSMPGGMMGSQGHGGMMASQGAIMGSQGALSGRSVTPLSSHMGVQPSQMNPGLLLNAQDNIGQVSQQGQSPILVRVERSHNLSGCVHFVDGCWRSCWWQVRCWRPALNIIVGNKHPRCPKKDAKLDDFQQHPKLSPS